MNDVWSVDMTIDREGIALVSFSNPPVNALSNPLCKSLLEKLKQANQRPDVVAIVVFGKNGVFSGGADITEFSALYDPKASPKDVEVKAEIFRLFEEGHKPSVAAINGVAFGGGLEMILCCSERVGTTRSSFTLPELKIGLLPGLGGTQRLPRVIGLEAALSVMLKTKVLGGSEAKKLGLLAAIVNREEELIETAKKVALELANGQRERKDHLHRVDKLGTPEQWDKIEQFAKSELQKNKLVKGQPQYQVCLETIMYGIRNGGDAGLKYERQKFRELVTTPTAKSLIHVFFATRGTAKLDNIPGVSPDYKGKLPQKCAVIGGGLMGSGIATSLLACGLPVVVKEVDDKLAQAAASRIKSNLESFLKRGKLSQAAFNKASQALKVVTDFNEQFRDVDLVIEAALEDVALKQEIFGTLEKLVKPNCILATNTSSIDIDLIASASPKAAEEGRVIGAHFFSPAHIMPLLEIVRINRTSPRVIQDLVILGKKMGKTPVVVGNCVGFAVNRMYFPQSNVSDILITYLGLCPYRVDQVAEEFGLPMGPFKLRDLVGFDVSVAVGGVAEMAYADRVFRSSLLKHMIEKGRKGQKTGAGFYLYSKNSRQPQEDKDSLKPFLETASREVHQLATKYGIQSPDTSFINAIKDNDIIDMLLLPVVNEGMRVLEDGISQRSSDLDMASILGMGFPAYKGGIMFWAHSQFGSSGAILKRLDYLFRVTGNCPMFAPSFALVRAAAMNAPLERPPRPPRYMGGDDDIVIVSGFRTAVGKAYRGSFKDTPMEDLIRPVMERLLQDTKIRPADIEDVVMGMVLPRGDHGEVQLRSANILAGIPDTTACKTVNRLCSSGLQAIADAAAAIASGNYNIAIAGGVESMSTHAFHDNSLKKHPEVLKVGGNAADCYLSMGETSENVAARYNISRERQDRLAVMSHARAAAALLSGKQRNEIVPVRTKVKVPENPKDKASKMVEKEVVVDKDEGIRLGVSMSSLAKLKPVFRKEGSTTAGNSSQISDGAAAVMLMRRSEAQKRGLGCFGTFRAFAVVGVEPSVMGIGPAVAIPALLKKTGLTVNDIDLFEINEAFGSQAEYSITVLGINRDVVNVNGGAIAVGHPLGMTGARQTVSLLNELHRRGGRYGVVSMCIGSGMGAAALYEITTFDRSSRL
eukprot:jgi/Galph1/3731/GphlegSOOS_G2410.1